MNASGAMIRFAAETWRSKSLHPSSSIPMVPVLVEPILEPRSPFVGLPFAVGEGRGVVVSDRDGLGLATVLAKKGRSAALAQRVRQHFHIELPNEPYRAVAGDVAFAGTAPGVWLVTQESGGNAFVPSLVEAIGDLAAISDQSDGYAVLRSVRTEGARHALQDSPGRRASARVQGRHYRSNRRRAYRSDSMAPCECHRRLSCFRDRSIPQFGRELLARAGRIALLEFGLVAVDRIPIDR